MRQIIYISTAAATQSDALFADLLEVSQRSNARDDVTGLLVAGGNRYLQIIEGKRPVIAALMARIASDQRHTRVHILIDRSAKHRSFADWSMAFLHHPQLGDHASFQEMVAALHNAVDPKLRPQVECFARTFAASSSPATVLWPDLSKRNPT